MHLSIFEAIMLLCFGAAWPFSIAKSVKTKNVSGKSFKFLLIVFIGYISGISHKLFYSFDYVIILYVFNAVMVGAELLLYFKYKKRNV